MSKDRKTDGGDLFIVDNSDSDWKVRDYLSKWVVILAHGEDAIRENAVELVIKESLSQRGIDAKIEF